MINQIIFSFFILTCAFMVGVPLGYAEDKPQPYPYTTDICEFSLTFPGEPYTTQRCDESGARCYDQVSYTNVFDMNSTVNIRAFCNPVGEDVIDSYSGEVMKATLRAMTKRSVVDTFETSFYEAENYKQAGLVGQGQAGKLPTLYIAQLWIGKNSAFSVEAELIGEASEPADQMFSDILKSVGVKKEEQAENVERESEDK